MEDNARLQIACKKMFCKHDYQDRPWKPYRTGLNDSDDDDKENRDPNIMRSGSIIIKMLEAWKRAASMSVVLDY